MGPTLRGRWGSESISFFDIYKCSYWSPLRSTNYFCSLDEKKDESREIFSKLILARIFEFFWPKNLSKISCKGWNQFMKERYLYAKDTISFPMSVSTQLINIAPIVTSLLIDNLSTLILESQAPLLPLNEVEDNYNLHLIWICRPKLYTCKFIFSHLKCS